MRRAFRKDEMPYPAMTTIKGTMIASRTGPMVAELRTTFHVADRRNCKKNKAQNLMPERMDGLHRGGKNVFDELARLLRQMLVGHDFILSKV